MSLKSRFLAFKKSGTSCTNGGGGGGDRGKLDKIQKKSYFLKPSLTHQVQIMWARRSLKPVEMSKYDSSQTQQQPTRQQRGVMTRPHVTFGAAPFSPSGVCRFPNQVHGIVLRRQPLSQARHDGILQALMGKRGPEIEKQRSAAVHWGELGEEEMNKGCGILQQSQGDVEIQKLLCAAVKKMYKLF